MTTKKKLIISISSMGLAVVAALGVTFGVLAAQQQGVKGSFSVSYAAQNVNAIAKASYKLKGGADNSSVDFVDSANSSNDYIEFVATEATTSKTLTVSTEETGLTANTNYIVYMFEFQNTTTAGGRSMTVELTDDDSTKTNVNVLYTTKVSSTALDADDFDVYFTTTVEQTTTKKLGSSNSDASALTLSSSLPSAITVPAQQYGYFFIYVEIDDNTIDASYVSGAAADSGLVWDLQSINS